MTKYEHSAGGVVFQIVDGKPRILLLQDKNGKWSFPKGLIEKEEDIQKTAEREIEEEVGLTNLSYVDSLNSINYFYKFEGTLIRKKVEYFLFEYKGNEIPKPQTEEGITDVRWYSPKQALDLLGYGKTNKPILEEAIKKIEERK